jgi:hypothetical protein
MILAAAEAEYFLWRGWTVVLLFCPSGSFVDAAAEFTRVTPRRPAQGQFNKR